ncbi:MAG: glycosyltransferase [Gammaproteobacteria bacterium]
MTRRIGVVIDPWELPYNGAVVSTRRFVHALEQAGYEFEILSIGNAGNGAANSFRPLSLPPFNGIIDAMRAPLARPDRERVRSVLARCDVLHVQYPFLLAHAAIREAKSLGVPVVCSFHVQPENILENLRLPPAKLLVDALYDLFIRFIYGPADCVIAPSDFAAELLARQGFDAPVTVVSNGIPDEFFAVKKHSGGNVPSVLSVGRLAREKQQETLIRAVALSEHASSIRLVLAGVGPRAAYLERLARSLGVAADIGWVEDERLLELYAETQLYVHSGTVELEGMSVLEAMAAGNAVIVSDSKDSACSTLVNSNRARFESGNAHDLARKLDHWLTDDEARTAAGTANRRLVEALHHQEASAALMAVYDSFSANGAP